MTIALGFAPFLLKDGRKVGIIDVPGHERFIKNMVAGATSIDIVMLIVAADESINIQTREHVSIMSLLGLKREGTRLQITPSMPAAWPGCVLHYRYGETVYRISVTREAGTVETVVTLDGQAQPDNGIGLNDDRQPG